jgi:hypothetical protein
MPGRIDYMPRRDDLAIPGHAGAVRAAWPEKAARLPAANVPDVDVIGNDRVGPDLVGIDHRSHNLRATLDVALRIADLQTPVLVNDPEISLASILFA